MVVLAVMLPVSIVVLDPLFDEAELLPVSAVVATSLVILAWLVWVIVVSVVELTEAWLTDSEPFPTMLISSARVTLTKLEKGSKANSSKAKFLRIFIIKAGVAPINRGVGQSCFLSLRGRILAAATNRTTGISNRIQAKLT